MSRPGPSLVNPPATLFGLAANDPAICVVPEPVTTTPPPPGVPKMVVEPNASVVPPARLLFVIVSEPPGENSRLPDATAARLIDSGTTTPGATVMAVTPLSV